MNCYVFRNDHFDYPNLNSFLESQEDSVVLFEFVRNDFTINLFSDFSNNIISPDECISELSGAFFFITPIVYDVISKASDYGIELVPISPDISFFRRGYIKKSDKLMMRTIIKLGLSSDFGLIIGYNHKLPELLKKKGFCDISYFNQ